MKKIFIVFFMCGFSIGMYADNHASKGAVIEGLFILENKHREVKESIQALKKELTECFSLKGDKTQTPKSRLDTYHCKLKQFIYPFYIGELERLIKAQKRAVQSVKNAEQVDSRRFKALVKKAFLLDDKIDLEKTLLEAIREVDTLRSKYSTEKKSLTDVSQNPVLKRLKKAITQAEKKASGLKTRVIIVNAHLFSDNLVQEVFFDKLVFRP